MVHLSKAPILCVHKLSTAILVVTLQQLIPGPSPQLETRSIYKRTFQLTVFKILKRIQYLGVFVEAEIRVTGMGHGPQGLRYFFS